MREPPTAPGERTPPSARPSLQPAHPSPTNALAAPREVIDPAGDVGATAERAGGPAEMTDLRLLPAALAGWVAGWVAPLLTTAWAAVTAILAAGTGAALIVRALVRRRHRNGGHGAQSVAGGGVAHRAGTASPPWWWSAAAACLVAASVMAVATLNAQRSAASIVDELAAQRAVVTAELRITGDATPVRTEGSAAMAAPMLLLDAVVVSVDGRGQVASASAPVVVLATDPSWSALIPSTVVRTHGRLLPSDRVSRAVAVLRVAVAPAVVAQPSSLQRAAETLRAGLRTAAGGLSPDARGLLPGLVVGDESLMPPDLVDDARTTGLTHLTAVSGSNVAVVLGVALAVARWCGLRAWAVPASGVIALAGFVVLARPDPSVLRASVMGLVVVAGLAAGSRRRRLSALCVAVVALVLIDPWLARSYGFALSVLASGAIVLIVPAWTDRWSRLPAPLAAALAVPIAAQVVCAPVIVMLSDQVSLIAVVANLLAAPAVAPATILGVLVAVVAPVAPGAAALLAEVAGLPVGWIAAVARFCADRPYAAIDWPGGVSGAVLLTSVTIACALALPALLRRPALAVVLVVPPLLVAFGLRSVRPGWPMPDWLLVGCDVGQGDALVISVGPGRAVVVDTGPEPKPVDDCLRGLGVREVPLLLLTHDHADHIGGLAGVLDGRSVGAIGIGASTGSSAGIQPASDTATHDTQVLEVSAGWAATIGPVRLEALWPPPDPAVLTRLDPAESAENNSSLVVRVTGPTGLVALLTGDIEPSAQRALQRSGVDLTADVLKVPHHGSSYQDSGFLDDTDAAVALTSVGADNEYGHPSAVTLDLLDSAGTEVFRTDDQGSIAVGGTPGQVRVITSGGGALVSAAARAAVPVALPALLAPTSHTGTTAGAGRSELGHDRGVCAPGDSPVGAVARARSHSGPVGAACDAGARWRMRTPPAPREATPVPAALPRPPPQRLAARHMTLRRGPLRPVRLPHPVRLPRPPPQRLAARHVTLRRGPLGPARLSC